MPGAHGRHSRSRHRLDAIGAASTVGLTALAQFFVLELWDLEPRVPMMIRGDSYLSMIGIRNITETGWWTNNSNMGAPFGQDLHDFPAPGDLLNFLSLKVMSWFTSNPALILNLFFLLSFPLVALTAYISLRALRVSYALSITCAVLYAFVPYHFYRGEYHLFLSSYLAVPLFCMLALRQIGDEPLVRRADSPGRVAGLLHRGTVAGLCIVLLLATTGLYYAVFGIMILGVVAIDRGARSRRIDDALPTLGLIVVIAFAVALQMAPTIRYQRDNGGNPHAVQRAFTDIEQYSLNLSHMLLPVEHHRLAGLAQVKENAADNLIENEDFEALGAIGSVGLAILLLLPFAALAGRQFSNSYTSRTIRASSLIVLASLLVATIGGLSSVLGALNLTQVRAWNRISVVIAFFALLTIALIIDRAVDRAARPLIARWVIAVVLVVVGLADQTTAAFVPKYDEVARTWADDGRFVTQIEHTVGPDASIFQYPIWRFPENSSRYELVDYDLAIGYLHSDTLRWSYGGIKGRSAEWQERLQGRPIDEALRDIAIAGFDGFYLDRRAYADRAVGLEAAVAQQLGPAAFESPDHNQVFFDMRTFRASVERDLGPALTEERARVLAPADPADYDPPSR